MAGLAEAAPIVGDHSVAGLEERDGLIFEHVARERPSVDQNDRPPLAGILYVEGNPVFCLDNSHASSLNLSQNLIKPAIGSFVPLAFMRRRRTATHQHFNSGEIFPTRLDHRQVDLVAVEILTD